MQHALGQWSGTLFYACADRHYGTRGGVFGAMDHQTPGPSVRKRRQSARVAALEEKQLSVRIMLQSQTQQVVLRAFGKTITDILYTNTKYRSHQSYQEHAPEGRTLFPNLFRGDNTIDTKIDTLTPSLLTHNRLCCVPIYIILSLCPFHSSSLRNYLLREAYSAHFAFPGTMINSRTHTLIRASALPRNYINLRKR